MNQIEHSSRHPSRGRFAPSTTGRAHPGTLFAALLCWLDARSTGGEVWLRLEDLDPQRSNPGLRDSMEADLEWFGLDWDGRQIQSDSLERYEAHLDLWAEEGRLYACTCSRSQIKASGSGAPDGSRRYPGTCRANRLGRDHWRQAEGAIRFRLSAGEVNLQDESGIDLGGDPARLFGDPLVRRRDGAYAYHFVSVVDDEAMAAKRVVRGQDLAPSTCLQVALRKALGGSVPAYHHHPLLLEESGDKYSKFHGAVALPALRGHYDASQLCGLLAAFAGLIPDGEACSPRDLVSSFDWAKVISADVALVWSAEEGLRRGRPEAR